MRHTLKITYGQNEHDGYDFDVIDEFGRSTGGLTVGEMLEQVIAMTHPRIPVREPQFAMLTEAGWAERRARSERRGEEVRAQAAAKRDAEAAERAARENALSAALQRLYSVTVAMDCEIDGPRPTEAEVEAALQEAQALLGEDVPF